MKLNDEINKIWADLKFQWNDSSATDYENNRIIGIKRKVQDIENNITDIEKLSQDAIFEMEKLK